MVYFKIPKKILKKLGLGLAIVSILVGLFTGDTKKAVDFFVNSAETVTTPIVNKGINIMEKVLNSFDGIVKKNR